MSTIFEEFLEASLAGDSNKTAQLACFLLEEEARALMMDIRGRKNSDLAEAFGLYEQKYGVFGNNNLDLYGCLKAVYASKFTYRRWYICVYLTNFTIALGMHTKDNWKITDKIVETLQVCFAISKRRNSV